MSDKKTVTDKVIWDEPLQSSSIPEIDLYMDQLLGLIEEKGITKTMINNYSKEKLLKPIKGKKYSKEQIVQILCIANLKQTLSMNTIKELMPQEDGIVDYQKVYDEWVEKNSKLAKAAADFAEGETVGEEKLSKEENSLLAAMMLSSCCIYFKKLCEAMIEVDNQKEFDE